MFENKTIAVFGGSGTIGGLIVKYLETQKPKTIRIITNDENSLWSCKQCLGLENKRYILCDIREAEKVKQVIRGADYVFNAAAIKHVPIAEYNPMESVKTNIIGLDNIIQACIHHKVKKLLHVSTDKAVEPTTLMGATKMVCERLLRIRWAQNPTVDMVCVRLGNIYGSRGSFVEVIRNAIENGDNMLTITNEDMYRFFMYEEDLIDFIILSFEKGCNGEIWVPKLKEKNIMDIVKAEGYKGSIEVIGNRKGEKLHEKLLSDCETLFVDHTHKDYWVIPNDWKVFEGDVNG